MTDRPTIHVVHATSPACHWSWAYEAVMNRLRMVYGDEIQLTVRLGCPYESKEQWLIDYGMTAQEASDWINTEAAEQMGVPIAKVTWENQPESCMPAVLAVQAARRQDEEKAWRLNRELVRVFAVEGKDPGAEANVKAAARTAGLDVTRLLSDLKKPDELREEYEAQGTRGPPVHVGFYNFVVWDGGNRRVMLDYAFDPREIEGAIDYLSGGTLKKNKLPALEEYLREHPLAPLAEIGRAYDFPDAKSAHAAIEKLEKAGKIERVTLAGAPHWKAT